MERGHPPPSPGGCPRPAPLAVDPARRRRLRRRPGRRDGIAGHGRGPARLGRCPGPRRRRPDRRGARGLGRRGPTGRQDHPRAWSPVGSGPWRTSSTMLLATGLLAGHLIPAGPARADDPARSKMPAASSRPAAADGVRRVVEKPGSQEKLTIHGRVLDPDGKPFAGAKVYAYVPGRQRSSDAFFAPSPKPDAISHADGRFQFTIPDPGLSRDHVQETLGSPEGRGAGPRIRAGLVGRRLGGRRSRPDAQAGQG